MPLSIEKVGVVGCGLMGSGIVQISAVAGYPVTVVEADAAALEKGLGRIQGSLKKLTEKGVLTADAAAAAFGRITKSGNIAELKDVDLVVEAIVEDLPIKKKLFETLGKVTKTTAILASNTSSFPIAEMGQASGRPQHMVGLHFFNPVQLMKLVEVVKTNATSADAFAAARAYAAKVGKVPVTASDTPGFIVNRLLVPYLAEALRMLERGEATKEDIDTAMTLGTGHPMGPITLLDYVGLDTTLFILEGWHRRFPDNDLFAPPTLLKEMVGKGLLGRKSGRGFYEWDGDKRK